jgi:hypothetical protein
VARDITLPLRLRYLPGYIVILHDRILAIIAKMGNGAAAASIEAGCAERCSRVFAPR